MDVSSDAEEEEDETEEDMSAAASVLEADKDQEPYPLELQWTCEHQRDKENQPEPLPADLGENLECLAGSHTDLTAAAPGCVGDELALRREYSIGDPVYYFKAPNLGGVAGSGWRG